MKNAFVIAAASSGSGKTTLALGLMRFLSDKGLSVMPFKCGPDYIDTQYHRLAAGTPSINLDLFMASEEHLKKIFNSFSASHDVAIVEGVMGMFDGYQGPEGSSADIAIRLGLPVILLVNAASTAYSVAATIYGFANFNKNVRVAGVIFNKVASESHYEFLKKACEDTGIAPLGYLSRNDNLKMPSRHLGLSLESESLIDNFIGEAAGEVARHVDVELLLKLTEKRSEPPKNIEISSPKSDDSPKAVRKVAVAFDSAFNFIYPVNLEAFNAEIIYFSPLSDPSLPEADLLYLPGGYPELFAGQLERNIEMRKAVKDFAEKGGKILAECGGMIYLAREIDGKQMCDVLSLSCTMENARLRLGYREIFFPDFRIRGHEFHYSATSPLTEISTIGQQFNAKGMRVETPVYRYKNVIATYTHLYWGETDIFKLWE